MQDEIVVGSDAMDVNGHVNNIRYLEWMQQIAGEHAKRLGLVALSEKANCHWYVRSHSITYLKQAFEGDVLELKTTVDALTNIRSMREYTFVRKGDRQTVVTASTEWVLVDSTTGRPRRITDEMRRLVED